MAVTDTDILRLMRAHDLPSSPVRRAVGGVVNLCFLSDDFAIRVNVRDPELSKFANEAAALELAARAIRVPSVVVLDESRQIVPFDVLITTRVDGTAVETLPDSLQEPFVHQAGAWLARLHSVIVPTFGTQARPAAPTTSLRTHLEREWDQASRVAVDRGWLTPAHVAVGEALVLEEVPDVAPTLTHNDWHFGNLLQRDGALVAAVDFEWATGDDPIRDLDDPLSSVTRQKGLVEGYQTVRELPDDWEERLERYRILSTTQFLPISHDKLGPRYAWAREAFAARLAWLRQRLEGRTSGDRR